MLDNNDDFSDDNTDELIRNAIGSNKETKSESIKLGVTPQQSKCTFTNTCPIFNSCGISISAITNGFLSSVKIAALVVFGYINFPILFEINE